MLGVILAGGKATRLGPLTAQLNKSLVTIGQKPMLIRQVQQLKNIGCDYVRVVTSPASDLQVRGVLARAGLDTGVTTIVQEQPYGPGDALFAAARRSDEQMVVMMADTLLDDSDVEKLRGSDVVLVHPAPSTRQWCGLDIMTLTWTDDLFPIGHDVVIGAFSFDSFDISDVLYDLKREHRSVGADAEIGMGEVLRRYDDGTKHTLKTVLAPTWRDVGDVAALAEASRGNFISREFHSITSPRPGVLRKTGASRPEAAMMQSPPTSARHLFPRVFEVGHDSRTNTSWYDVEHIDAPSLAELWLYWPSKPDMWEHVARELIGQLHDYLWVQPGMTFSGDIDARADAMYRGKLIERYAALGDKIELFDRTHSVGRVNGIEIPPGDEVIAAAVERAAELRATAHLYAGRIHGDPNFTNVLWSLRTGSFKLLDPRGSWGGVASWGDMRYDIGKIAYSPAFSAVTHRLFDMRCTDGENWSLTMLPDRALEIDALERPIREMITDTSLSALRAHLFLSSAPLHPEPEASALYLLGVQELFND